MGFLSALSFLTVVPIGKKSVGNQRNAALYFPLIGLVIGAMALGLNELCRGYLFPEIRPVLIVFFLAVISGGLHLDGLADSADGLLSHRDRERKLNIMHDPRIGVMGTLVLIFCLALKFSAVAGLSDSSSWVWLLCAPALARTALTMGLVLYPHARPEGGTHSGFYQKGKLALLSFVWIPFFIPFAIGWSEGIITLILFALIFIGFNGYVRKSLGGLTGDTHGALSEIMETSFLLLGSYLQFKGI